MTICKTDILTYLKQGGDNMGLLGSLASFLFDEIVGSNEKVSKFSEELQYSDAVYKKQILTEAKIKARNAGRTDLLEQIESKTKEVDRTINQHNNPKF